MSVISKRRAAAAAHFAHVTTSAGRSFSETATSFLTLLSPGVLYSRSRWWRKARLWRLVMAQSTAGCWDATDTVAFALEARSIVEVTLAKASWVDRLKERLSSMSEAADDAADADLPGDFLDTAQDLGGSDELVTQPSLTRQASTPHAGAAVEHPSDDPLHCSAAAVLDAMPRRLAALRAQGVDDVERVWATLCCCALLQTLNCCWLVTDGELYPQQERTVVDAGRQWLESRAEEHPALAAALAGDALERSADRAVAKWHRAWAERVGELRRSTTIRDNMARSHLRRTCTELMRALCTKHSTFSVFLSAPLDGLQRWQRVMIIFTTVVAQLLVNSAGPSPRIASACTHSRTILSPSLDVLQPLGELLVRSRFCCLQP